MAFSTINDARERGQGSSSSLRTRLGASAKPSHTAGQPDANYLADGLARLGDRADHRSHSGSSRCRAWAEPRAPSSKVATRSAGSSGLPGWWRRLIGAGFSVKPVLPPSRGPLLPSMTGRGFPEIRQRMVRNSRRMRDHEVGRGLRTASSPPARSRRDVAVHAKSQFMTGQFGPRQYLRGWNPSASGDTVGGRA